MLELKDFEFEGKIIKLKKPLPLEKSELDKLTTLVNNDVEIIGLGNSQEDAFKNVRTEFARRYEEALKIFGMVE